jgi:CRP/FNR family transcriptional regulator
MSSVAAVNPQFGSWIPGRSHDTLPFFDLKGEASATFASIAPEISRARAELLFREGESATHVFIVCSGRVKLFVNSRDGRTTILRIIGAGEILGLTSAMSGRPHEASAEAIELCRLKAIPVNDFLRHLRKYPEAAAEATTWLLRDYQAVVNNIYRLTVPSTVAGRLASLLLEWLETHDTRSGNRNRLIVSLSQEEIASMANTSRETVSRVFHQFQQQKLISIKGAAVTILQPRALEELVM